MGFFRKGAILTGFGEPLTLFKQQKTCQTCGKGALYWAKHYGQWKLHHYAVVDGGNPKFHLHRCGLQADGKPSVIAPYPPVSVID